MINSSHQRITYLIRQREFILKKGFRTSRCTQSNQTNTDSTNLTLDRTVRVKFIICCKNRFVLSEPDSYVLQNCTATQGGYICPWYICPTGMCQFSPIFYVNYLRLRTSYHTILQNNIKEEQKIMTTSGPFT